MKINRTAWAVAALTLGYATSAQAQSSLTIFGVVDLAVSRGIGSLSTRSAVNGTGANLPSRIGFRGVEDLGGGLSASFWLEAGFGADEGTGALTSPNNQLPATAGNPGTQGLTFNRRSTVSLSGSLGEIRLGRDFTPTFWNHALDPFILVGVGSAVEYANGLRVNGATAGTLARASNSVGYFLPANILGGLYGQAMYAMGENQSNAVNPDDGRYVGARIGYQFAKGSVAIAHGRTTLRPTASTGGDYTDSNIGASYDFGVAQLRAIYDVQRQEQAAGIGRATRDSKGFMLALVVPVGATQIKATVGQSRKSDPGTAAVHGNKTQHFAVGVVQNLSKRTVVYATVGKARNSGGANFSLAGSTTAVNQSSSGFDVGLRHSF